MEKSSLVSSQTPESIPFLLIFDCGGPFEKISLIRINELGGETKLGKHRATVLVGYEEFRERA